MLIHLLHMTVYDPNLTPTPGENTLRFSSDFGYNDPTAPGYHRPRLKSVVPLKVTLSADPRQAGPVTAVGSFTFDDTDGVLRREFLRLGIAGFIAAHYVIDAQLNGAADYATAQLQAVVTLTEPTIDIAGGTVTIGCQDAGLALQGLLSRDAFAGDNTPPTGVEGTANDVGGQYKRSAWGRVRQIAAQNCNASRAVDLLHDGQSHQILAARAGGVAWTMGSARAFANIDDGSDPSAGVVDYFLGDGTHATYSRRRSVALNAGPFTYDLEGDARGGTWRATAADIAAEWVAQRVDDGPAVVTADVTALNGVASAVVGFYDRDGATVATALNALLPAVHGKWWLDTAGFRMGQLTAPSGDPVAVFRALGLNTPRLAHTADIVSARLLPPDLPIVWRVIVRYRRFYSVQTQGLDANIDPALRSELINEWRSSDPAEDPTIKAAYKGAIELVVDTMLDAKADADALAVVLLDTFGVPRDPVELVLQADPVTAALVQHLTAVRVHDILDYGDDGKLMRVLGRSAYDPRTGFFTAKVWG